MNLAQRANLLQAHNLRCQGLTLRQIGDEMGRAPSTIARYLRDFNLHRSEITESLAADLLVHSVAGIQTAAPDLHRQHINSARELRLLLNSLDQVEDRRQRRERRIHENNVQDAEKHFQGIEEIAKIMIETGHWDVNDDITDLLEPVFGPSENKSSEPKPSPSGGAAPTISKPSPSGGGAPKGRRGPATITETTPNSAEPSRSKPAQKPTKTEQNRTGSNNTEQEPSQSSANHANSRSKRKKSRRAARKQQRKQAQLPVPARTPSLNDIPDPPFDPKNLRPIERFPRPQPQAWLRPLPAQ